MLYSNGYNGPMLLLDDMLYKYQSFYTFCMIGAGMICFVLSLEEGFYAYQFKQMGWAIVNLLCILGGGHGLLFALWKVRIWFVYTILCLSFRACVEKFVSNYDCVGPRLHALARK